MILLFWTLGVFVPPAVATIPIESVAAIAVPQSDAVIVVPDRPTATVEV